MPENAPSSLQYIIDRFFYYSIILLVTTVWASATIFGCYIVCFYALALIGGDINRWNDVLPGLYDPETKVATTGIGLHFLAGGTILILGCIQLIERIRMRFPKFHRIVGRIYIVASLLTAIGGLTFVLVKGTIGGLIMDIAFGLYGILMFGTAVQTFRYAAARRLEKHRAWAIRLFALAIGSWLYRMDYGFWFMITDRLGHTSDFTGPFDYFMDFFFYLPNLLVAEIFIGRQKILRNSFAKLFSSILVISATLFLVVATYFFSKKFWLPGIIEGFGW